MNSLKNIISVICGVGLFISAPFIFSALAIAANDGVIGAFILMFFGQVFLNMNWAIVVDISLVNQPIFIIKPQLKPN
jgi:hypothetical protein